MMTKHIFFFGNVLAIFFLTVPSLQAQKQDVRTMRYYENLTARLADTVRAVQDENANLEMKVSEMQRQIKDLQNRNKEMEQELQRLKRQSAAEAEAREVQMRELSKQIKKLALLPPPTPSSVPQEKDPNQKYEIFEVPKGATLSAIAKAYNVSIQSIKRANNLKDNNLRIGQKLKIPVK